MWLLVMYKQDFIWLRGWGEFSVTSRYGLKIISDSGTPGSLRGLASTVLASSPSHHQIFPIAHNISPDQLRNLHANCTVQWSAFRSTVWVMHEDKVWICDSVQTSACLTAPSLSCFFFLIHSLSLGLECCSWGWACVRACVRARTRTWCNLHIWGWGVCSCGYWGGHMSLRAEK